MKDHLYKSKYAICFYDCIGERFLYMFDNINDILTFMNKPMSERNKIAIYICKALKKEDHRINFLTGETMTVYLVDIKEDDDESDLILRKT